MKTYGLIGKRYVQNVQHPVTTFTSNNLLQNAPLVSQSVTELWNPNDTSDNWILTAGKIENLRIASRKLHGIEVKAHKEFSFWRHIGNPNWGKGYVVGREIREGCIVPTVAGGLCQLSNALYDAALQAHFTIVERHRHTKVVAGSLAEQDRDATVKWNYIDLRFKATHDFRIEVELDSHQLIVRFKGQPQLPTQESIATGSRNVTAIHDCYSCGNRACFKHEKQGESTNILYSTTFILDEKWPEFDHYIQSQASESNQFIVPLPQNRLIKTTRYSWTGMCATNTKAVFLQGLYRALKLRLAPKNKNNIFELGLALDQKIARAAAALLPIDATHLVISQNLLPYIFATGALGGRTFDVFMTRLPLEKLHERLDYAHNLHPESTTLHDFRAPSGLVAMEREALTRARKLISPHAEIAQLYPSKVVSLSWAVPKATPIQNKGQHILFPGATVGRKGAYEMRQLAQELGLRLVIMGKELESQSFWGALETELFSGDFTEIGCVIYPTYIEQQPRILLKAIAKGIPVITTSASGLTSGDIVHIVPTGFYGELKQKVLEVLPDTHLQNEKI
jgi:hypothetical protein